MLNRLIPLALVTATQLALSSASSLASTLAAQPSLSILNSLLHQFDLIDSFNVASNITLLAPTDDAYRALAKWGFNVSEVPRPVAQALLTYHVLDGTYLAGSIVEKDDTMVVHSLLQPPVLTNVSRGAAVKLSSGDGTIVVESGLQVVGGVVETDIYFDGGVIHTLNGSMVLPHNISVTAELGRLTEFLNAMEAAAEVDDLESLKDCTVFIPHNGALKELQPLLRLLSPQQLAKVMRHHAVPGKVLYHDSLADGEATFSSLQGTPLHIHHGDEGDLYINGAKVVRQDMIIYGGVAHIIDDVLIPNTKLDSDGDMFVQTGV